ncbi:MAG TPA: hypothetical protein VGG86_13995 [Roseiarcus sp.]|jgi:hypothetical protein
MPISRRYTPEHAPGESCSYGLDFSFVVPVGVGVESGTLQIFKNDAVQTPAGADWQIGPVTVRGRAIYASLSGGVSGVDYQLKWTATDSQGNAWPRTCLVLCADTS